MSNSSTDECLTTAYESALRECLSYNKDKIPYRFRQATMLKLEKLDFVMRAATDMRKRPAWFVTDSGAERLYEEMNKRAYHGDCDGDLEAYDGP